QTLLRRIAPRANQPPLDVFLHIDLTDQRRMPAQRETLVRDLRARGATVWNAALPDLSKPAVQRWNRRLGLPDTTAARRGSPSEWLIVKTSFNCFSATECQLSPEERVAIGYARRWTTPIDAWPDYPILRRKDVPEEWWRSRKLAIERFIRPSPALFFRVSLAGEGAILTVYRTRNRLGRPGNSSSAQDLLLERSASRDDASLRLIDHSGREAFRNAVRFSDAIGLDFGAIDLVFDGTDACVVDVNPTVFWGRQMDAQLGRHLRRGMTRWRPASI
ncbi:MAG TPA: hypothetical protein VFO89_02065, partial [Thermoanaerobaculia bacterium]|nr:hypothetical protein [Thermoanaerobaculia bacterium]